MNVAIMTVETQKNEILEAAYAYAQELLHAGDTVKLIYSENCEELPALPESEGRGQTARFADRYLGRPVRRYDYTFARYGLHPQFWQEVETVAESFVQLVEGFRWCVALDVLQGHTNLVHNVALRRMAQELPRVKILSLGFSAPLPRPKSERWPNSAYFLKLPATRFAVADPLLVQAVQQQYALQRGECTVLASARELHTLLVEYDGENALQNMEGH